MDGALFSICWKKIYSAYKGTLFLAEYKPCTSFHRGLAIYESIKISLIIFNLVLFLKDDIGDKSVFTFMSLSEDEKKAIVEKLEQEKLG